MKITYYNSTAYQKTTTTETRKIWSQMGPEEMTDYEREEIRRGNITNMCCFNSKEGMMAVPWEFVIEITDDHGVS